MTDRPVQRWLAELRTEARYRSERLRLYKARVYAGKAQEGRLSKLQRASDDAAERLRRAEEDAIRRREPQPPAGDAGGR